MLVLGAMAMPSFGRSVERWERTYGTPTQGDYATDVSLTADQGCIALGTCNGGFAWLLRIDSLGDTIWTRVFDPAPGIGFELRSVVSCSDGGYAVAGVTSDGPPDSTWVYVLKMGSSGDSLWAGKFHLDTSYAEGTDIIQTHDHGFFAVGEQRGIPPYDGVALCVRLDSSGHLLWMQTYHTSYGCSAWHAAECLDRGFAIAGSGGTSEGVEGGLLVRTDCLGNMVWIRVVGPIYGSSFNSVCCTPDSGFLCVGWIGTAVPERHGWLAKFDRTGWFRWQKTFGTAQNDCLEDLTATPDSCFLLAGWVDATIGPGPCKAYLAKVDSSGNILWAKKTGSGDDRRDYHAVVTTQDSGFITAGDISSGAYDLWLTKTDVLGSTSVVEKRSDQTAVLPLQPLIELPGVVNHTGRMRYYLPKTSSLTLDLYDATGRLKSPLVHGQQTAGWHKTSLPNGLATGVYCLSLIAGAQRTSARVVLLSH